MAPQRLGVLCVGSIIVDLAKVVDEYPEPERLTLISDVSASSGGPAMNLAVALRRLGAEFPLDLVGVVGEDEYAVLVREECAALGIGTSALRSAPGASTSFTDAMVVRDGGARTFFHHPGANALLAPDGVDIRRSTARILHVGAPGLHPLLDAAAPGGGNHWASLLRQAQTMGMRTTLELVSLAADKIRAAALSCLPHLDYLVINEIEAAALAQTPITPEGVDGHPDWVELEHTATRLLELGVARLVVIHFPAGCVAAAPDGQLWRQGSVRLPRSLVRNTTGAGDAFAAGVVYGLHEHMLVPELLELAVGAAAASIMGVGTSDAVLPAEQCMALSRRHGHRATSEEHSAGRREHSE